MRLTWRVIATLLLTLGTGCGGSGTGGGGSGGSGMPPPACRNDMDCTQSGMPGAACASGRWVLHPDAVDEAVRQATAQD